MRTDRSTPVVLALFQERFFRQWWRGACLPRELIRRELEKRRTPLAERTLDWALNRAVNRGELVRITSDDGGALYALSSLTQLIPSTIESVRRLPLRSLNSRDRVRAERAVRWWQSSEARRVARRGGHDLREGHKCIACNWHAHRDTVAERFES